MICCHALSLAINPEPHREQGRKTIVQSLFPFHGKQDFSISQTAFEHLTCPNQTSLHHVAVTQPSGAEKSHILGIHSEEQIAGYTSSGLFAELNDSGMKMCLSEKRWREITHCPWWLSEDIKWTKQFLLANQMWFPGNSGTHCGETRLLVPGSKSRSNIASPFAEVGTWPQIEWMVVILPLQSQCLLPDTAYVLTDTFTINSWINFINLFI